MARNLAERIEELRELAIAAGVADRVGCLPNPAMLAMAYAHVLGFDQHLALDPELDLEDVRQLTDRQDSA